MKKIAILLGLLTCLISATNSLGQATQGIGLIQDTFKYSAWNTGTRPMDAVWSSLNGNLPTNVINNPDFLPSCISLNDGMITAPLGRTLTADFQMDIDVQQTAYESWQWVGLYNSTMTGGYAVGWDSKIASQYGGEGAVVITRFDAAPPGSYSNTYGTFLGSEVESGVPALAPSYIHFTLKWHGASHTLTLYVNGTLVSTQTDSTYSSFSNIVISGDNSGVFANLSVTVPAGAPESFTSIEAETGSFGGGATMTKVSGAPSSTNDTAAMEASGHAYVAFTYTGNYVSFINVPACNSLVIRNSIPDASGGGGTTATLSILVNGTKQQTITLNSFHNWLYGAVGANGQSNTPSSGAPHDYWDEARILLTTPIPAGATVTLEKESTDTAAYYDIDVVDFEQVGSALPQPSNSLSVMTYGATGNGTTDDTTAIKNCIAAAQTAGKSVWMPTGTYVISSNITLNGVVLNGAGMWYTTILGKTYSGWMITFEGASPQINNVFIDNSVANSRTNSNYCIAGDASNFSLTNIWITHYQLGIFMAAGTNTGTIYGCRVRSTYADGIHLDGNCTNVTIQDNHVRGCGDDGIAVLSWQSQGVATSGTLVYENTVEAEWWGANMDLAGGTNNQIEYNYFADNTGDTCVVINMPTYAPMDALTSGTIDRNVIVRGGGNFSNDERPGIWISPQCATIADLLIQQNFITDCYFSGISNDPTAQYNQGVTYDTNTITNSGGDGILINTATGTGDFTNNVVTGVGLYQSGSSAFVNNGGSNYTATQSGNSWQ